jgi:hypothetical protein
MREQASLRISWCRETGSAPDGEILILVSRFDAPTNCDKLSDAPLVRSRVARISAMSLSLPTGPVARIAPSGGTTNPSSSAAITVSQGASTPRMTPKHTPGHVSVVMDIGQRPRVIPRWNVMGILPSIARHDAVIVIGVDTERRKGVLPIQNSGVEPCSWRVGASVVGSGRTCQ